MTGPLDGVTVVELSTAISAPYCGALLADSGATVIKIEPPRGDPFRGPDPASPSPVFARLNRGKRSVVANLAMEADRGRVRHLVDRADVFLANSRPGRLEKYGLGHEDRISAHPRLVYCSITGFGDVGPERNNPGYDPIAVGLSGLWSQLSDIDEPIPVGPPLVDLVTGAEASRRILTALIGVARTGSGSFVEVNLLESALELQLLAIARYTEDGVEPDQLTRSRHSQTYAAVAGDGRPLTLHLTTRQDYWSAFLTAVGAPGLADRIEFETAAQRIRHYDELAREIATISNGFDRDELVSRLTLAGVPAAPILTLSEALAHPQVIAISATRANDSKRSVPALGEHTESPFP